MAVHVLLAKSLDNAEKADGGWVNHHDPRGVMTSNLHVGTSPAAALNRLKIVGAEGHDLIRSAYIHDQRVEGSRIAAGTYNFQGVEVMIRATGPQVGYLFAQFEKHQLGAFTALLKLLKEPDFTTNWLERIERRPVTEWGGGVSARRSQCASPRASAISRFAGTPSANARNIRPRPLRRSRASLFI